MEAVKITNPDDWPIYWLMYNRGLRVGEVVSNHRNLSNLPGLLIEDLRSNGIHVRGKKGHDDFVDLPDFMVNRLKELGGKRQTGVIFKEVASHADPVGTMDHRTKQYAKLAGLEDWQYYHPHASRHAFGYRIARLTKGDAFKTRDMMRHSKKNIASVSRYVHEMDAEEKVALHKTLDGDVSS